MTEVLGYHEYVGQGGDWVSQNCLCHSSVGFISTIKGSLVMEFIGQNHSENGKLILYNMFFSPPSGAAAYSHWIQHLPIPQQTADYLVDLIEGWGLPEPQLRSVKRHREFTKEGSGYFVLQSTRVIKPDLLCPK